MDKHMRNCIVNAVIEGDAVAVLELVERLAPEGTISHTMYDDTPIEPIGVNAEKTAKGHWTDAHPEMDETTRAILKCMSEGGDWKALPPDGIDVIAKLQELEEVLHTLVAVTIPQRSFEVHTRACELADWLKTKASDEHGHPSSLCNAMEDGCS